MQRGQTIKTGQLGAAQADSLLLPERHPCPSVPLQASSVELIRNITVPLLPSVLTCSGSRNRMQGVLETHHANRVVVRHGEQLDLRASRVRDTLQGLWTEVAYFFVARGCQVALSLA